MTQLQIFGSGYCEKSVGTPFPRLPTPLYLGQVLISIGSPDLPAPKRTY